MKFTIISLLIAAILIVGALMFSQDNKGQNNVPVNNVSIVDDKQIIEIRAKGGYIPRQSKAQAGLPTILRLNTGGTFDCSAVVRIPKLGILQNLPLSGATDIDLGTQKAGTLQGSCGMGMYPFEIIFN